MTQIVRIRNREKKGKFKLQDGSETSTERDKLVVLHVPREEEGCGGVGVRIRRDAPRERLH